MTKKLFLGIDTSNYTTSAALTDSDGGILANEKILLEVAAGERGLRQSDAVFLHTKNLPIVFERVAERIKEAELCAIGVSVSPRSEEGSYMPCFLAGMSAASAASAVSGARVYEFSHQEGHVMAALMSSGAQYLLLQEKFIAFHVSGGTTDVLLVNPTGDRFKVKRIGGTLDLNMGQAIDRIGVKLGYKFPCGAALDALALGYAGENTKPSVCVRGLDVNLSGLENMALGEYEKSGNPARTAHFALEFCLQTILALCGNIVKEYGDIPLLFSGGVMSSAFIRARISAKYARSFFAPPEFSSDNAAGAAWLALRAYRARGGE